MSATFQYVYVMSGSPPNFTIDLGTTGSVSGGITNPGTHTITSDVSGNTELEASENFEMTIESASGGGTTRTYLGKTASDELVFANSDLGTYWLATNTEYNDADPVPSYSTTAYAYCFAAGTLIATPEGETAVETLQIGDIVTTADGRAVPVKWIGRQTLLKLFAGERACPVRVAAGALGGGLPHTDLVLTADHALILDGLAINAGALVNGTTITLDPLATLPERVTYYHVETEAHDVILANGVPAETFVDYVGRQAFNNHAEYVELYGDESIIAEMPLPRISTARLVPPALRQRFAGVRAV